MVDFYQQNSARMSYQVGCIPYCLTLVTPLSIIVPHFLLFKFPFARPISTYNPHLDVSCQVDPIASSENACFRLLENTIFYSLDDKGSVPHQVDYTHQQILKHSQT